MVGDLNDFKLVLVATLLVVSLIACIRG
ncbi:hypothetical protein BURKHO8Y_70017 [Burkholderia sp. 8Y]|nr:hypothetical protein BURKHO8Y_70017 [Burkholderia sp. 8Y]